ncbi:membrane alanyl aminopeptidase-like [Helicoverpa zea]|uniref:membrane alanyl aminopeptidase-like n=1 Tax=Helicoverpa zea TaxID=7113 RepID=UPI001F5A964F|nr:membrane alanyl aminopeptidase-like [Helicoverpa zea]
MADMYQLVLVLALTCLLSSSVSTTDTNYRLNTPIVPSQYQILITPYFATGDANQFTFDGTVSILFKTTEITNQIKLHSEDLTITPDNVVVVIYNTGATIGLNAVNGLEFNTTYTFAYINLDGSLEPGVDYVLQIKYKGPIRKDLSGFYRNHYYENGVTKWLGATQMEPTHARKVFPCFDEPELKATFIIAIDRPAYYQPSLSNTEMERRETLSNGLIREIFYPTPRMSTYLVAFLVSEFEAAASSLNGTQEFGVYTRPEAKNQSTYAFEFGKKVVDALGGYFGINYYSTNNRLRLDHVALPDFRAGAMENWGLIKYREALLLYVPEVSTPYFKYRVAQIVAHETTHMWFGNLVTCHWWSNTWLNEGFANYFQDYITAFVDPEVGSEDMLVTGSVYSAYDADNMASSPPISNVNVNSPAEISGHFGTITYQKAGSVIRMMHHLVQDNAFRHGLNVYLNNNSFSSGYPEKLYQGLHEGVSAYNALSSYPGANIADVMSSWITQAGHPVLKVDIDYETDTVTLSQKRYYFNSSVASTEVYKIPITYTTQMSPDFDNTKPVFIMENKTRVFQIANISNEHSWVIFNVQETGLYRVNYDDHSWQIIISALKSNDSKIIHHLNRAKIINDLFALVYADELSFSTLDSALGSLSIESDYSVWYAALRGFSKLWHYYQGDGETLPYLEQYILRYLDIGISKLGYEPRSTDSFEDLRNRMQLLEFACKLGHNGCVENSVALFKGLRQNGTEVSPSLRPVVYCTGLHHGDAEDYEFLWNRMLSSNVANEVWVIGDALGCTSSDTMKARYLLSVTLENTPIRTQDLTVPLSSILRSYENRHIVMNTLMSNYTQFSSVFEPMDTVLSTVASVLHSENDFDEFESFLSACTECTESAKTAARKSLEQSKSSTAWAKNHKADILNSIKSFSNMAVPSTILIILGLAVLIFTEY